MCSQKKEQQESSQGGSGRKTGTVRKERRSSIKDLIKNFNDITKGGDKVTKERMNRLGKQRGGSKDQTPPPPPC